MKAGTWIITGIHIDARGVPRGYTAKHHRLSRQVKDVRPNQPPWSVRYPEMRRILEFHPEWPTGTVIEQNVTVACQRPLNVSGAKEHFAHTRIENNPNLPTVAEAGFADPAKLDFALRKDSTVLRALPSLPRVPFRQIGLQTDQYRGVLPARDME